MFTFKKKPLTDTRVKEITDFIQTASAMSIEDYLEFFNKNRWYCGRAIFDFYTLPKTDLHYDFRNIGRQHREIRTKQDEEYKSVWMANNVKEAQSDPRLEKEIPEDRRYKIIRKLETTDDIILVVWIPYDFNEVGKWYTTKFAYTTTIPKSTMPNLYKKILDNMPRF